MQRKHIPVHFPRLNEVEGFRDVMGEIALIVANN